MLTRLYYDAYMQIDEYVAIKIGTSLSKNRYTLLKNKINIFL